MVRTSIRRAFPRGIVISLRDVSHQSKGPPGVKPLLTVNLAVSCFYDYNLCFTYSLLLVKSLQICLNPHFGLDFNPLTITVQSFPRPAFQLEGHCSQSGFAGLISESSRYFILSRIGSESPCSRPWFETQTIQSNSLFYQSLFYIDTLEINSRIG